MPAKRKLGKGLDQIFGENIDSVLDDIEGIGPTRRKALLRTFKTVEAIRDASEEELLHAPSMNAAAARRVWEYFHAPAPERQLQEPDNMV